MNFAYFCCCARLYTRNKRTAGIDFVFGDEEEKKKTGDLMRLRVDIIKFLQMYLNIGINARLTLTRPNQRNAENYYGI